MAVQSITPSPFHEHAKQWEGASVMTEALLALGSVVLSILGIVGLFPTYISAIAVIGLGVVLLFRSVEVVVQYSELLYEAGATNQIDASRVSQGITTELLAGMAGIVMGVLALLGIALTTLLSVAVITYGAAMLLTSGESLCLDSLDLKENDVVRQLIHSMSLASAGAQALVGLAAMVLGILGLVGIASTILVLVALLAMSASILLRSSSVGRLLLDFLQR
jgi:hypothetical protein